MQEVIKTFIGRFSIFHSGHAEVLLRALQTSTKTLVIIGSSFCARNTKNPFTFEERREMILNWVKAYPSLEHKLEIRPAMDFPYDENKWIGQIQNIVESVRETNAPVYLTGAIRDSSTYYLNIFGDFFKKDFVSDVSCGLDINATALRDAWFQGQEVVNVPQTTKDFLNSFDQDVYNSLVKEYNFIIEYKKAWSKAPFAPTFNTVDAVVIQSGYVLVNVRDNFPGVGLWALPGGFLEIDERMIDGAVRELQEETSIELAPAQLYGSIKAQKVFDDPNRSLRGRTITQAFLFSLNNSKPLPKVKPQKGEVKEVKWILLADALSHPEMWFEDHYHIMTWGVGNC